MTRTILTGCKAFWSITAVCFIAAVAMVVYYTPTEATMGAAQKIFYLHMPVAIGTLIAAMVVFIASIGYLSQRNLWWDDLAAAAAKVTIVLCSVVLLTGMIWGKSAWGQWWTWSPRLTFSLVLWLLYVVYATIRPAIHPVSIEMAPSMKLTLAAWFVPVALLSTGLIVEQYRLNRRLRGQREAMPGAVVGAKPASQTGGPL